MVAKCSIRHEQLMAMRTSELRIQDAHYRLMVLLMSLSQMLEKFSLDGKECATSGTFEAFRLVRVLVVAFHVLQKVFQSGHCHLALLATIRLLRLRVLHTLLVKRRSLRPILIERHFEVMSSKAQPRCVRRLVSLHSYNLASPPQPPITQTFIPLQRSRSSSSSSSKSEPNQPTHSSPQHQIQLLPPNLP
ncbi:unnamed protein product [Lepeophtheirus salmonis]|uniref:(salmon louse) hypothetical protein n=1 Tax=Lepeophtheirus salmonis TaxID=72036 RepID=A0A7R8CCA8_LEPSM|nr:unnamed protein product [Lepeophtheirus salmonis]CAF2766497.1 unnamed protein product [Lepeophtheirus salmonis]